MRTMAAPEDERMSARQQEQRSRMIEENIGLVHACAHRFKGKGIEYDDLFQAGCMGLVKATDAFDSERGVRFSTYAVPVILGEIKRVFRDGGAIHVSRGLRERAMRLQKLQEVFEQTHGRTPTLSELSVLADCTVEACAQALCVSQAPLSLTQQSDGDGEQDGQLDIPVEAPDRRIGDLLSLRQEMEQLAPRDRMLLELRYFRELTQTKTAQILGMTQVQVSRREKKLLSQLREALK